MFYRASLCKSNNKEQCVLYVCRSKRDSVREAVKETARPVRPLLDRERTSVVCWTCLFPAATEPAALSVWNFHGEVSQS